MPIRSVAYALPSLRQTSSDIARATGADEHFISEKVGLQTRYILAPGETGVGLATSACKSLFDKNPGLSDTIDLLICIGQTPDRPIPHNSAQVVSALDLPHTVASFDLSLGCSGYVYGVVIAEGFLNSVGADTAIVVTCDPYSRIIAPEDRNTNCIFGDAATATWVSRQEPGGKIVAVDFGTDGSGGDAIQIRSGGAAAPFVCMQNMETRSYGRDDLRLQMTGRAVFNFVNSRVPQSINTCLKSAGLVMADIDAFLMHQGSSYMLDAVAKRANIPPEKLIKNMNQFGNTVSSSIPLLLNELDSGDHLRGSRVLLSGFGVGLSWATSIVEF